MTTRIFCFTPKRTAGIFSATLAAVLTLATPVRAAIRRPRTCCRRTRWLLITVPDFSTLRTASKQSPQCLLWNDAAMKPFHDKFMPIGTKNLSLRWNATSASNSANFTDLPQGQLTLAVTQNGWTGGGGPAPGVLLLLDTRDKSGLLKTNLAALRKNGRRGQADARRNHPGHLIFRRPLSSNDIPATLAGVFPRRQPVQNSARRTNRRPPAKLSSASLNRC